MSIDLTTMVVLHAGCAAVYALLTTLIVVRRPLSRTAIWLALACLVTTAWAVSVAIFRNAPASGLPAWLELARSAAWYAFILHLFRRSVAARGQLMQAFVTMGLLALLVVGGLSLLDLVQRAMPAPLWTINVGVRLGIAVCNLLLLENLYRNTPAEARWHINLLCVALGGVFLYDLVLYADALLFHAITITLFESRAPVTVFAAPLIAIAAVRDRRWKIDIHVSRDVVFHSMTLVASGLFLMALAFTGEVFRRGGAEWGHVVEVSLVCAGLVAIAVTVTSGSMRSRVRSILVDNFFSHRYDYRREWSRCIDTLTAPDAFVGLHTRAIRAVAEVVDSPAGVLFARAPEDVAFQWAGSLNTPAVTQPIPPGHKLIAALEEEGEIVLLDSFPDVRAGLEEIPRAWLAVPLNHFGKLIGFVVVTRPRAPFKLDNEVFQLLGIVGREVASRVAEQRASQILSQTRELRDYSQRFAFVLHDIKNVSGQLSMLLANAEVHADNPEFQRDMLATVRASVGKITRLLARLQAERQERGHALTTPWERLTEIVDTARTTRDAEIELTGDSGADGLAIDPEAFDAVAIHLLNNALDASPPDTAVRIELRREGMSMVIDIADEGPGMAPEFVRDELFRPFSSTKGDGHGIGGYQARELLREAGGDLLVISKPGSGTIMRMLLPLIRVTTETPKEAA
jgi:putative PEP-CTERM system histidine kinase